MMVRRHVVSENASRQQQIGKKETDRDITNKKRSEKQ
jgi:hypothetical protein